MDFILEKAHLMGALNPKANTVTGQLGIAHEHRLLLKAMEVLQKAKKDGIENWAELTGMILTGSENLSEALAMTIIAAQIIYNPKTQKDGISTKRGKKSPAKGKKTDNIRHL